MVDMNVRSILKIAIRPSNLQETGERRELEVPRPFERFMSAQNATNYHILWLE